MLVTKQNIFKNFWYPIAPLSRIQDKPLGICLLEHPLVVWMDENNNLSALHDRCCHRSAKLSLGKRVGACLQCPYHGWCYDHTGTVVHIPQLPNSKSFPNHKVTSYKICERYGYAWVCLGKPIYDIPEIKEVNDPKFRLIQEFYETWNCAGLRVMENELDLAHPAFVHTKTFGNEQHLVPSESKIVEFENGLHLYAKLGVTNPIEQQRNLKLQQYTTVRHLTMSWFLPFTCKLDILYPNGLRHIIVNTMTPINDAQSQMVQFCLRNDTEAETPAADVIAFDRQVTLEDKAILESTDYDVPLNHLLEKHLFTDKPGIIMRKKIKALLEQYGEQEVTLKRNSHAEGDCKILSL